VAGRPAEPDERWPLQQLPGAADPGHDSGNSDYYMGRYDLQFGHDHFFASIWHQRAPAKFVSALPQSIANETYSDPQNSWVNRFNWDRTVTATTTEPHVDGVPEPQRRLRLVNRTS
jgi:hypothetical protein